MAFVPPKDDKIKKLGKKEKIPAYVFADPDDPTIIYIKTNGVIEILDNSVYEVVIPNLEFEDGEIIDKYKCEFTTKLTPCYVSVEEVLALCNGVKIPERDILMHIRTASLIVDYWASRSDIDIKDFTVENVREEYYPFFMFIKYKAAVESLKEFYIGAVTDPYKYKDALSDLIREEEMDLEAIKKLIDDLNLEAEEYLNYIVTMTADPEWALRGKYAYSMSLPFSRPYHDTFIDKKGGGNGWGRGY